jgi:basic membrane protein A and related proteins
MKKLFALFIMLMLTVVLAGCGEQENACPDDDVYTIGLVTDSGGIDDRSFNQGTWEGIVRYAEDNDLVLNENYKYLQSANEVDYSPNLTSFADACTDLIVAPGYLFLESGSLPAVAEDYPHINFLLIDSVLDAPNVASAVFAEHEGSFLVGVAAALKAQEMGDTKVGFVGGMDSELIQKFEAGYEQGVKAVAPNMQVLVEYAGSFTSTSLGQEKAESLFNQGARIIYHAAGGAGGGVIRAVKDKVNAEGEGEAWAIGVDKDQYDEGIYAGTKSVILTSMIKKVDVAAYEVAEQTKAGDFPGGEVLEFNLNNEGVGIPKNNPNLSQTIIDQINELRTKIINGEIEVSQVPSRKK